MPSSILEREPALPQGVEPLAAILPRLLARHGIVPARASDDGLPAIEQRTARMVRSPLSVLHRGCEPAAMG